MRLAVDLLRSWFQVPLQSCPMPRQHSSLPSLALPSLERFYSFSSLSFDPALLTFFSFCIVGAICALTDKGNNPLSPVSRIP